MTRSVILAGDGWSYVVAHGLGEAEMRRRAAEPAAPFHERRHDAVEALTKVERERLIDRLVGTLFPGYDTEKANRIFWLRRHADAFEAGAGLDDVAWARHGREAEALERQFEGMLEAYAPAAEVAVFSAGKLKATALKMAAAPADARRAVLLAFAENARAQASLLETHMEPAYWRGRAGPDPNRPRDRPVAGENSA